jgi:hypothetical protein
MLAQQLEPETGDLVWTVLVQLCHSQNEKMELTFVILDCDC